MDGTLDKLEDQYINYRLYYETLNLGVADFL